MSQLLSTFSLGGQTLKNRIVMAPLTRGRAGTSRVPNDLLVTYYEQRASAGLIIAEATAVSEQGYGWYGAPGCYTEEQSAGWKKAVDAVHAKGGKIYLQLWHMGRQSHPSFHANNEIVSSSAIKVPGDSTVRNSSRESVPYETPRALTTEEIPSVVQDYKNSARLAKLAGFDGVELHGANGYLIDQFLQKATNQRTDRYGGSFENRYRFLDEVVRAVGEVYPPERIGVRVSPNGGFAGMGSDDNDELFLYVAERLSAYGLAYLHVMDGLGFGKHDKCRFLTLHEMKARFRGPVMGNVDYTRDIAEGAVRSGAADLIAFGRPYISNPDLVERFTNNWPLSTESTRADWYDTEAGPRGYTDFPAYGDSSPTESA